MSNETTEGLVKKYSEKDKGVPFQMARTADALHTRLRQFGKANDPQPMHTDVERAARGPFGLLVASGWQIAALSMHVFVQAGGYGETPIVGLGIDELRWLKPVRPGDRLVAQREIVEIRRSETHTDRGVLRTRVLARNQHGDIVMSLYTFSRVPARPVS